MTFGELEAALDSGRLFVRRNGNRWQKATRTGLTKLTPFKVGEFTIPCKVGNTKYFAVTERDLVKQPSDLKVV